MEHMYEKFTFIWFRTVQCSTHAVQHTYSAMQHTCKAASHMQCIAVQHIVLGSAISHGVHLAAQMICSAAHCSWRCSAPQMQGKATPLINSLFHFINVWNPQSAKGLPLTFTRTRFPHCPWHLRTACRKRIALDIYVHAVSTYGCGASQMQCSAARCPWSCSAGLLYRSSTWALGISLAWVAASCSFAQQLAREATSRNAISRKLARVIWRYVTRK